MAGLQRQRDLAEHIADKWRIYGFDEVEMPEYEVPLSLPQDDNPNKVEVVVNGTKKLTILGKLKASDYSNWCIIVLKYSAGISSSLGMIHWHSEPFFSMNG